MDTTKAIELIEKAHHIAILTPPSPDLDNLASAEVLTARLKEKGKHVGFKEKALPREFIVTLDTISSPISQLRYEKTDNSVEIIFSPKELPIAKESISFREGKMLCDLGIAIGVQNIEKLEGISPEFSSELPVINIDISGQNGQYGEVNLVNTEKSSLAELTYDFLTNISQDPLDKKSANLLLGALISKTGHFSSNTSADTMLTASELIRLGGTLSDAAGIARESRDPSLIQLQGRAMVRSKFEEDKGVLWSFVTAEDFGKTGRSEKDIPALLGHMQKEFPPHAITAILCQQAEGGSVVVTLGGKRQMLETLESRGIGKFASPYLRLSSSFESFREAEEIVGSLLASIGESA